MTELVTSCMGTAFYTLLKGRYKKG